MNKPLQVALVYTSKKRAQEVSVVHRPDGIVVSEDEEPPPDSLAEYDAEETISAVTSALSKSYAVTRIEADEQAYLRLQTLSPDLVFNISEGFGGPNRESHIPILCEMLGLPYTGSDALTLGICLDKARTKEILTYHGVPTARFTVAGLRPSDRAGLKTFPLPAIVKPIREGSSKGIRNDSLVKTRKALLERVDEITRLYKQPVLVEEFLTGREFTVGILGNEPDVEILPPIEINHAVLPKGANPIYGYEAKWLWDDPENPLPILICPAKLTRSLERQIRELVLQTLSVLRVRDWCRLDVRLDAKGRPKLLELNPLPGILPDPKENSSLPTAARAAGYGYDELILRVVETALKRLRSES